MFGRRKQQVYHSAIQWPEIPPSDESQLGDLGHIFSLIRVAAQAIAIGQSSGERKHVTAARELLAEATGSMMLSLGTVTTDGMAQAQSIVYCLAWSSTHVFNDERCALPYMQALTQAQQSLNEAESQAVAAFAPVESAVWNDRSQGRTNEVEATITEFLAPGGNENLGAGFLVVAEQFITLSLGITLSTTPDVEPALERARRSATITRRANEPVRDVGQSPSLVPGDQIGLYESYPLPGGDAEFIRGAIAYENGDFDTVEAAWTDIAATGNIDVIFGLGRIASIRGDKQLASIKYEQAALGGHALAAYNLGVIAQEADDLERSRWWYTKAIEGGSLEAAFGLGSLERDNHNPHAARVQFELGASNNHAPSMFQLGILCEAEGDEAGERRWHERAADLGHLDSMYNLGIIMAQSGDVEGARDVVRRAAALGHERSPDLLAQLN